jgi:arylsulfatase A-like enzyme
MAAASNMPTLDRIAANGLIYTQWHTTALCSPTRSTLLTGLNHHLNGMVQRMAWLQLTPAQRLAWLEEAKRCAEAAKRAWKIAQDDRRGQADRA